ncbi:MAG TPA: hypothetical protein VGF38_24235 [Ktedonobacterales bacterium]|jgi:hypothetical protein
MSSSNNLELEGDGPWWIAYKSGTYDAERSHIAQIHATVTVYWYVAGPYSTVDSAQAALEEVSYDPPKPYSRERPKNTNYTVVTSQWLLRIGKPFELKWIESKWSYRAPHPWERQTTVEAHRVKGFPKELGRSQTMRAWFSDTEDEDDIAKPDFVIRRPKKMRDP